MVSALLQLTTAPQTNTSMEQPVSATTTSSELMEFATSHVDPTHMYLTHSASAFLVIRILMLLHNACSRPRFSVDKTSSSATEYAFALLLLAE